MADTYANYAELAANHVEGVDYSIYHRNGARLAHIAIHGGGIEVGTLEAADFLSAGRDYAYYAFDGRLVSGNSILHITSTNFDEPIALGIVASVERVVSWHGASDDTPGMAETWIGGLDAVMRDAIMARLIAAGFTVTIASDTRPEIAGVSPDNIANRSRFGAGVQLELSTQLRHDFFPDGDWSRSVRNSGARTDEFYAYMEAVDAGINDVLPPPPPPPAAVVSPQVPSGIVFSDRPSVYEVWATRYDDAHVVEQVPARGLSFSMPLSDHGECRFTATVESGRSTWRPALTPPFSGVLVTRDGVPQWDGWLRNEQQTGPRTFSFQAREWGSFFQTIPARVGMWTKNDHQLFRDQVFYAQLISGQNVRISLGATLGGSQSTRTVNLWDNASAEEIFTQISDAEGGPEWYFGSGGTRDEPIRPLILGDRLGSVEAVDTLHYVEDTEDPAAYGAPPTITLLSDLFPVDSVVSGLARRGGNVLLPSRVRDTARAATVVTAVGDGSDAAQKRQTAQATRLLAIGWPRMTRWTTHSSVSRDATLLRHAQGDLATVAGIATGYGLATLDGDPDWTQVPRGSTMRVILDTDAYANNRPHTFESRLLNLTVDVPDDGGRAQVTWELAEVLEAG